MDDDAASVDELPPYRALLVVDMKDFSGERGRDHGRLTEEIPRILRDAFRRRGIIDVWDERRFHGTTGDGYFAGFGSVYLPYLLNPFLVALQEELEYRNRVAPVTAHHRPIRMRVSVHVGPMTDSGTNALGDGSGAARVETHRLLDSDPVRELLKRSAETTRVAAIVSARAFEDAVLSGYAADSPDLYVPAPVQVKTFQGTAYLRVPHPSGGLLVKGFRPDGGGGAGRPRDDDGPGGPDRVDGDTGSRYRIGTVHGSVGGSIAGSDGPVHMGSGDQLNTPRPRRRKSSRDGR
jgi:hypothetical protein